MKRRQVIETESLGERRDRRKGEIHMSHVNGLLGQQK